MAPLTMVRAVRSVRSLAYTYPRWILPSFCAEACVTQRSFLSGKIDADAGGGELHRDAGALKTGSETRRRASAHRSATARGRHSLAVAGWSAGCKAGRGDACLNSVW